MKRGEGIILKFLAKKVLDADHFEEKVYALRTARFWIGEIRQE
jgi:hypothetical protein